MAVAVSVVFWPVGSVVGLARKVTVHVRCTGEDDDGTDEEGGVDDDGGVEEKEEELGVEELGGLDDGAVLEGGDEGLGEGEGEGLALDATHVTDT